MIPDILSYVVEYIIGSPFYHTCAAKLKRKSTKLKWSAKLVEKAKRVLLFVIHILPA